MGTYVIYKMVLPDGHEYTELTYDYKSAMERHQRAVTVEKDRSYGLSIYEKIRRLGGWNCVKIEIVKEAEIVKKDKTEVVTSTPFPNARLKSLQLVHVKKVKPNDEPKIKKKPPAKLDEPIKKERKKREIGGMTGKTHSEETKKRMSEARIGNQNAKKVAVLSKQRMSEARKKWWAEHKDEKHPYQARYGNQNGKKLRGYKQSDEHKEKKLLSFQLNIQKRKEEKQ